MIQIKTYVSIFLLLFTLSGCQIKATELNTESLILKGEVKLSHGTFGGYSQLIAGDIFTLNLSYIGQLNKINFSNSKNKSYIPLPGPLKMSSVYSHSEKNFQGLRLISENSTNHRVTLDIIPYGNMTPPRARVLILSENPMMNSFALVDCSYKGSFPKRTTKKLK